MKDKSPSIHFKFGQQAAAPPRFNQFHGFLWNNGHSLSAKGADHSNFIATATTHLESGNQTYNQAVFQVCSKIRIFPIVIDSRASVSVSPCEEDFYEGIKSANEFKLSGLADDICVKGMGWVRWRVIDQNKQVASIDTIAYFVPKAGVWLVKSSSIFPREWWRVSHALPKQNYSYSEVKHTFVDTISTRK